MPRNVKDSDDEMEPRSGRRTRAAINTSVLDSPLRRSSRIKAPVHQEGSSPESVNDVSATVSTRSNKRRTVAGDAILETARSTRTRRNSVASDISEITETESLPDAPAKRITRRSIIGLTSVDTPPKINGRTRRATRAGSESKSTPPVVRALRKTRATSLEPEGVEEVASPVRSRRRASVLPSEPVVAEESEDSGIKSHRGIDKTVYEIDEDESVSADASSFDTSKSSRRKSNVSSEDFVEPMDVDESPVEDSEGNTVERLTQENIDVPVDVSDVAHKPDDPVRVTNSAEVKTTNDGSSIETCRSPSIQKQEIQEKSVGNKENEILNELASLRESSVKLSNIDGLLNRKSLGSVDVKPLKKRLNISIDDSLLANYHEKSTRLQGDSNVASIKNPTERSTKKDRYSVDECVVVIEPMEIDLVENSNSPKPSFASNLSGIRKEPEVVEIKEVKDHAKENEDGVEIEEIQDIDCELSKKDAENIENVVIEDDSTDLDIDEKNSMEDRKNMEEHEVIEEADSTETMCLEIEELSDEDDSPFEGGDNESALLQSPGATDEHQNSISEDKTPNDDAEDEKVTIDSSNSTAEPPTPVSEDATQIDNAENNETLTKTSNFDTEPTNSIPENASQISDAKDDKTSEQPSSSSAESENSISADAKQINDVNIEKETEDPSDSCKEADNLIPGDVKSTIDEKRTEISSEASVTNPKESNDEAKAPTSSANDENSSTEVSTCLTEPTVSSCSINDEKSVNSEEIEDNTVFAKGRKSSIVTESPMKGVNGEDAASVSEEQANRRKSGSSRRSSLAVEEKNASDEVKDKSPKKQKESEKKVAQSDEESDEEGYPAFKDIPADEWTGDDNEDAKKDNEMETNSMGSVSTQRNESECDLELVDKELLQKTENANEKEDQNYEYDSDDTVKIAVATGLSQELSQDEDGDESEVAPTQEMPMEVSSDEEDEASAKIDSNKDTKRRISLNSSSKLSESSASPLIKKNVSLVGDSVKDSPKKSVASSRKSLLTMEDQLNDSSNSSMKLNSSLKKTPKKRNSIAKASDEDLDGDNEDENNFVESGESSVGDRKSLGASNKKNEALNTSRKSLSAKNTPVKSNEEADKIPARRSRSLNKSGINSLSEDAADSVDSKMESETMEDDHEVESPTKNVAKRQSQGRLSIDNTADLSSSVNTSLTSKKIGSARKSLSGINPVKLVDAGSDSDVQIEKIKEAESSPVLGIKKSAKSPGSRKSDINKSSLQLSQRAGEEDEEDANAEAEEETLEKSAKASPRKSLNKSNAKIESPSSESDMDAEAEKEDEESVEAAEDVLEKSVKIGSAKKSANKNSSKLEAESSGSESDNEESQESLDRSSKIGSAKKSPKPNSTISLEGSDGDEDDAESQETLNRSSKSGSTKKSVIDKNYSTIVQINSDSEVDEDVQADSSDSEGSWRLPEMFKDDSDSNDEDSASIDEDVAREMNLDGRTSLTYSDDDVPADDCMATESESDDEDDDGADLLDFVVDDDEVEDEEDDEEEDDDDNDDEEGDEEAAMDVDEDEDEAKKSTKKEKQRKRIIPRLAGSSDSDEDDEVEQVEEVEQEQQMNVTAQNRSKVLDKSNLNTSKTVKTPAKTSKLDTSQETLESEEKATNLNLSLKGLAARNKNLMMQSSTPKSVAKHTLTVEKTEVTTTPIVNRSLKTGDSSMKLENSKKMEISKKLSKSVCETTEVSSKLSTSFKLQGRTAKLISIEQQLQTSLPIDLSETLGKTNLSKVKSTKIASLNQTVVPAGSGSPETRFLMKEKLNDSMPALKLQQKAKQLRRSVLDNLREEAGAAEQAEEGEEDEEAITEKQMSVNTDEAAGVSQEVSIEKKKKKKKKKKKQQNQSTEDNTEEIEKELVENVATVADVEEVEEATTKKAKKNKKKSVGKAVEPEETKVEEVPKTKKKKNKKVAESVESEETKVVEVTKKKKKEKQHQQEEEDAVQNSEPVEVRKQKKNKKKDSKPTEVAEPEVKSLKQKSRRTAARKAEASDSDEAPETVHFEVARDAALRDLRKMAETLKAGKEAKRKKLQELSSRQEATKGREEAGGIFGNLKSSVKRLPDEVLENLSEVPERPKKRRKLSKDPKFVPSTSMFTATQAKPENLKVDDGYIPLSSAGGTSQFVVANLKKIAKHSKKSAAAVNFREKMLARNPRQPISAYLMYQQKQKATGQGRPY